MIARLPPWLVLCGITAAGLSQETVNKGAQIQSDFQKRVEDYVKLRKTAHEGLPKMKSTKSPGTILSNERALAHRIRELRRNARQGDLFTPEISAEFRRLIGMAMQGTDAAQVGKSLHRAEPVHLKALRVNQSYTKHVPLQSTPSTLLLNLPKLPPELEYRVVGRALVLRDVEANLIVDFFPDAIPVRSNAP